MWRRWHNLLAPFFAAFLMLLAITGAAIQVTDLLDRKDAATNTPHQASNASSGPTAGKSASGEARGRSALGRWNHWLKKLHSGEIAGVPGIALNVMTAVALAYFSGSGLWMYLQPRLRRRRKR